MAVYVTGPRQVEFEHILQPSPTSSSTGGRVVNVTFTELASDQTTTSDISPPTAVLLTQSITTLERATIMVNANASMGLNAGGILVRLGILVDGVRYAGRSYESDVNFSGLGNISVDCVVVELTAGTHTIDLVWSTGTTWTATCTALTLVNRHGASIRTVEYQMPPSHKQLSQSGHTFHLPNKNFEVQHQGGQLIGVTKSRQIDPIFTTTNSTYPGATLSTVHFNTTGNSNVLIDVNCQSQTPSQLNGAGTYTNSFCIDIDGTTVYGRQAMTRTTNQQRQIQMVYANTTLTAGRHIMIIRCFTSSGTMLVGGLNLVPAQNTDGHRTEGCFNLDINAIIREFSK